MLTCCSRSGRSCGTCSPRHRRRSCPWISASVPGPAVLVVARRRYSLVVAGAAVVDGGAGDEESGGGHCEGLGWSLEAGFLWEYWWVEVVGGWELWVRLMRVVVGRCGSWSWLLVLLICDADDESRS